MAVLITGLGYIGIALATRLLERGERVVGLENGFSTVPDALRRLARQPGMRLVRGSVSSPRSIERAFADGDVTIVYHLAGQASAHPEAATAAYTERTNLVGPRLVYEAAARRGVRRFVYASSFKLYGDDLEGVVDERRPYGFVGDLAHVTKVYAEKLLEMLAGRHDPPVANVRLGIVYGLGPAMKTDQRFLTVPNLFCLRAARGEPLIVHSGANRPMGFLHLDDAVDALLASGEAKQDGRARAYNAVSEMLSVGEVAGLVRQAAAARGLRVRVDGATEPRAERYRVSSALERSGFVPGRAMRDTLPAVLDYYSKLDCGKR
jgi:UDP-glucuronate 4-epimerase